MERIEQIAVEAAEDLCGVFAPLEDVIKRAVRAHPEIKPQLLALFFERPAVWVLGILVLWRKLDVNLGELADGLLDALGQYKDAVERWLTRHGVTEAEAIEVRPLLVDPYGKPDDVARDVIRQTLLGWVYHEGPEAHTC